MTNGLGKLNFNLPLCGRDVELSKLQKAYSAATQDGSSKVVVVRIHGASGVGKSCLVETFRQRVCNSCVFGVGKFEKEANASEPFSAIVDALNEIVEQLDDLDKIRQEFGSTARVLATILPKLQEFKNDKYKTVARREATTFDRLKLAARDFLRLVCVERPVVMFLDDLQWARSDSLKFIETLISDTNAMRFLFIGSHREIPLDNAVHGLFFKEAIEIPLVSFSLESVVELIAVLLKKEKEQVHSLAAVVHRKTRGDAFFVIQFLRFLEHKGFLTYSLRTFGWEWDVYTIQSQTHISDNVVDMIVDKIQTTSASCQLVLTVAACAGLTKFDLDTLYSVVQAASTESVGVGAKETIGSAHELSLILEAAVRDGLLEELSPGKFKFAHDRVLESAHSLLPGGNEQTLLHYHIGHRLQELSLTAGNDDFINGTRLLLLGVRQLNLGVEYVADQQEGDRLARLNLEAAEVAMQKSAFFPAVEFLEAGIARLESGDPWNQNYELALKLYTSLATMKLCCGDLNACQPPADTALRHARSLQDKVGAYHVSIERLVQQERLKDAIELSLSVLDQFGVHFPRRNRKLHLILILFRTKRLLKGKSDQDLLSLPKLTNEAFLGALPVHSDLGGMTWLSGDETFLAITILTGLQIVLSYGQSESTCVSYATYSIILGQVGDIKEAFRFSKLALQLADESELHLHKPHAIALAHFLSYHWFKPYHESLDPIFKAYEMTLEIGDVRHLIYRIYPYCMLYLCCGLRLSPLESDMAKFVGVLNDYSLKAHVAVIEPLWQMVLNLMGKSDDPLVLSGEVMDQEPFIVECAETNNERALQSLRFSTMCLAYYFGDLTLAEELVSRLVHEPGAILPVRVLFEGLISLGLAKATKKKKYKRKARRKIKQVEKWVKSGAINCFYMLLLLRAEMKALEMEDPETVQKLYDNAISTAAKLGILHHQALANERAGVYFLEVGDSLWAETYLTRARDLYIEWDAWGKATQLEEKYSFLNSSSIATTLQGSSLRACKRLEDVDGDRHKLLLD